MVLFPCPVSTRQLTYLGRESRFVGEISSTNGFGRIYDDACDEGLTLVSARTGVQVVFAVSHEEVDSEGDVLYWDLVPVARSSGGLPGCTVRLFND